MTGKLPININFLPSNLNQLRIRALYCRANGVYGTGPDE